MDAYSFILNKQWDNQCCMPIQNTMEARKHMLLAYKLKNKKITLILYF